MNSWLMRWVTGAQSLEHVLAWRSMLSRECGRLGPLRLQVVSVLAGMTAGNYGWKHGLIGFFGVHALAIVGCILFMVAVLANHFMRRNESI
jgi:hypothetical protein